MLWCIVQWIFLVHTYLCHSVTLPYGKTQQEYEDMKSNTAFQTQDHYTSYKTLKADLPSACFSFISHTHTSFLHPGWPHPSAKDGATLSFVEPLHARQAPKTNWTESCHANQSSLQSRRKVCVASRDPVAIGKDRKGGGDAKPQPFVGSWLWRYDSDDTVMTHITHILIISIAATESTPDNKQI